eukprot:jgi/Psemu1/23814/gm1.23814_g
MLDPFQLEQFDGVGQDTGQSKVGHLLTSQSATRSLASSLSLLVTMMMVFPPDCLSSILSPFERLSSVSTPTIPYSMHPTDLTQMHATQSSLNSTVTSSSHQHQHQHHPPLHDAQHASFLSKMPAYPTSTQAPHPFPMLRNNFPGSIPALKPASTSSRCWSITIAHEYINKIGGKHTIALTTLSPSMTARKRHLSSVNMEILNPSLSIFNFLPISCTNETFCHQMVRSDHSYNLTYFDELIVSPNFLSLLRWPASEWHVTGTNYMLLHIELSSAIPQTAYDTDVFQTNFDSQNPGIFKECEFPIPGAPRVHIPISLPMQPANADLQPLHANAGPRPLHSQCDQHYMPQLRCQNSVT